MTCGRKGAGCCSVAGESGVLFSPPTGNAHRPAVAPCDEATRDQTLASDTGEIAPLPPLHCNGLLLPGPEHRLLEKLPPPPPPPPSHTPLPRRPHIFSCQPFPFFSPAPTPFPT